MQCITVTTVGLEVELRREGTEGVTREKVGLGLMEALERPSKTRRDDPHADSSAGAQKNGQPKILPPADYRPSEDQIQDLHVLRRVETA